MRAVLFFAAVLLVAVTFLHAESEPTMQPLRLIDVPTAGTLNKGQYLLDFRFFSEGGVSTAVGVGLTNRFSIGIAYELMRVIGNNDIKGQSFPGGMVKYRLMEESYYLPGIALGFESQGAGEFFRKSDNDLYGRSQFPRFYFKSKGFFAAVSKSYLFLGQPLGFHGLLNYSAVDNQAESEAEGQNIKSNRVMNGAVGMDKSINEELALTAEYDLALDDNHQRNPMDGYLNAGIRWALIPNLMIELDFKDILGNKKIGNEYQEMLREIRILYVDKF